MENFNILINSNNGPLSVSWSDASTLAKYANIQSGFYLEESRDLGVDLLTKCFKSWTQGFWTMRENSGMFDFRHGATIVDIGSGIGVTDLLLYSYVPGSKFYLVDNEGWDDTFADTMPPSVCYSKEYPIYNSWKPVLDAIQTSNFDPSRFVMQIPTDPFPNDADVIMSSHSWCFHYPKEVYWDRIMSSLKKGGKLLLDVRHLSGKDVVGEISEEFKCNPVRQDFPKLPEHVDNYPNSTWSRCLWTKNV